MVVQMTQIKIFKGLESGLARLEGEVNEWIAMNKINVKNIIANLAPQTIDQLHTNSASSSSPPSDVLLIVVFEK